jgi:hypothetical protein
MECQLFAVAYVYGFKKKVATMFYAFTLLEAEKQAQEVRRMRYATAVIPASFFIPLKNDECHEWIDFSSYTFTK